ncbi:MAG: 2-C-methyl-D-erythritol 2,4-cyclodiphosphate synthase [Paludibacteraceae bacterium]|nr:2-C-methyl-D-erythritol 2,4-cyclodiphosphate synthase [Paludibacteraceae bacterium]
MIRVGFGYDVHKFAPNRQLWLGGILVPSDSGLEGHSDADVLIHALCDALLGAAHLRDIGYHFPPVQGNEFENIDSKILLARVINMVREKGYELGNADCTICAQKPRLGNYIEPMQECLAEVLGTDVENVSVKATTTEHLGFVGREEGISAYASVLIYKV